MEMHSVGNDGNENGRREPSFIRNGPDKIKEGVI